MSKSKIHFNLFIITVTLIAILALFGPEEQSLGANVRIVYLHGAWVLTAELVLLMAGLAGLIGLISPRKIFHGWSAALGRTGIFFWVTYLPLSLWAMQSNWNGLFLAEPAQFPEFTELLYQKGYNEQIISGILGGNFLRVVEQVWK